MSSFSETHPLLFAAAKFAAVAIPIVLLLIWEVKRENRQKRDQK